MSRPKLQTAIIQSAVSPSSSPAGSLPLAVSDSVPIPALPSSHHVLIRVLAVALNPTDFKMVAHFPRASESNTPALPIGCDFCGVVEDGAKTALESFPLGTRVCGGLFPYGHADEGSGLVSGAFAQWVAADANQLLRVPDAWDDLQAAAVGGICWGTCVLALFADPEALALQGRPSKPEENGRPVIVYGAATATGTMACQLLRLTGHFPIAVTSTVSAPLARTYGAVGTAAYTSPTCAELIRSLSPGGTPIRHALDCITSPESVAICLAAIGRAGGRYACLESLDDAWRTRKAVRTKVVMGFEAFGLKVALRGEGGTAYSREANAQLYARGTEWTAEMQAAVDRGQIKPHPVREVHGRWEGIIEGLEVLRRGDVRGQKLVVRVGEV